MCQVFPNFRGRKICVEEGDSRRSFRRLNDRVSSIRFDDDRGGPKFGVKVFEREGFAGHGMYVAKDIRDLSKVDLVGGGTWDNRIKSVLTHSY